MQAAERGIVVINGFGGRQSKASSRKGSGALQASNESFGGSSSSKENDAPFTRLLLELQEELRAYVFLFVEVACVGHTAPACRRLESCVWSDGAFWRAYAGVCVRSQPMEDSARSLRNSFRRWLFHLDENWSQEFANVVAEGTESEFGTDFLQMLSHARYLVSGLMPSDGLQQRDFLEILCSLLTEYDPMQLDERGCAESLVAKVETRGDIFTEEDIRRVMKAYEESLERAVLEQHLEGEEVQLEPMGDAAWQAWEFEEEDTEESFPGLDTDFTDWPHPNALELEEQLWGSELESQADIFHEAPGESGGLGLLRSLATA